MDQTLVVGTRAERGAEMCARKDGAIPGQRRDALRCSGHLGRKQTISLSPSPPQTPFGGWSQKNGSFFVVNFLLAHSAGGAAGREALCPSGHTEPVPEVARRTEGFLATAASFDTALPTSDFHTVGIEIQTYLSPGIRLISISRDVLCACSLPESSIAPYLTELQKRVKEEGIRVGSYPFLMKGVFVSLIGQDEGRVRELGKEVEGQTQGKAVTEQEIRETKRSVSL